MSHTEFATASPSPEERSWALIAHLINAGAAVLSAGTLAWLGPLLILVLKGNTSTFVADHARATLNWCITAFLFNLAIIFLMVVVGLVGWNLRSVFLLTLPLVVVGACVTGIISVVGGIQGGMAADRGELYVYPLSHRFLK